ncbi:MAG: MFS transporter [Desulfobacteraceae bacterium]|nr:MAG: MFS transporter [Desulfobacteraceae bacterium]
MRFFYGWVIVAAGFIISVIGMGSRYSFGVFFKSMEIDFGMTRSMISGFFSIYMVLSCVIAVLGGWALDRKGPRKVVLLMSVFTGMSMILTSRVHSPWLLLFTYSLLLSLGTGPTFGLANTTTSRWFVRRRGFFLGITSSGGGVGAIVFAPFATYLITNFDWRTAFLVIGVVSGLILMSVSLLFVKDPQDLGLLPDGGRMATQEEGGSKTRTSGIKGPFSAGFTLAQAWRMPQFWFLGSTWLFISLSVHMIFVHIVPYAVDAGIEPMDAALIISLIGFTNIPGRLVTGRLSDAFGRKALAVACPLLQCVVVFSLMWARELWMLYAFGIVFGFLWGGAGTMVAALIGDTFGVRSLGSIMGLMSGAWALGAAIGPAIGGYIFDVSGEYFAAFGAGAAALLMAGWSVASVKVLR